MVMGSTYRDSHFEYSMDSKRRVSVPSDYRAELKRSSGEEAVLMTLGPNGALFCLSARLGERLRDLTAAWLSSGSHRLAGYSKILFATSGFATPDANGRVVVPSQLAERAGLGRTVHWIAEGLPWFELWDAQRWATFEGTLEAAPPVGTTWSAEVVRELMDAFNRALSDLLQRGAEAERSSL